MDTAKIKREQLSAGGILKISFSIWARMFRPCFKILALAALFTAAFFMPFIIFAPKLKWRYMVWGVAAANSVLLILYIILALAMLRAAYDIFNTKTPSVIDGIDKALRALPRLFAVATALAGVFCLLSLLRPRGGAFTFSVYAAILAVWCAGILLYFGFYIMALLFRGSGILATFKTAFLILKSKWAGAFFKTLLGLLTALAMLAVFTAAVCGGLYLVFNDALAGVYAQWPRLGFFVIFYHGAQIWLPLVLLVFLSALGATLAWGFMAAYMTGIFLNTELPEEPDPATGKIEILSAAAPGEDEGFTEFFRNSKAVDVTERIQDMDNTVPAMARPSREEALRDFTSYDEPAEMTEITEIPESSSNEDDILEVLSDLKEPPTKRDKNLPSSIISDKSKK